MIGVGALGPGELALVHFTAVAAELVGLAVALKKERHNSQDMNKSDTGMVKNSQSAERFIQQIGI